MVNRVEAVFLHIPKTAGTSFRHALAKGFGGGAVSEPFVASRMDQAEAEALHPFRLVAGHISITDARRWFPGAALVTVVRDPVQRCLSWYYFARGIQDSHRPDVVAARTHDVASFFALDDETLFQNIFNRQVRQLGDHVLNADVDLGSALRVARQTLDECAWVGRQETLRSDMAGLSSVFPEMDGSSPGHLNATTDRPGLADIPASVVERIIENNRYDLELYAQFGGLTDKPPGSQGA